MATAESAGILVIAKFTSPQIFSDCVEHNVLPAWPPMNKSGFIGNDRIGKSIRF